MFFNLPSKAAGSGDCTGIRGQVETEIYYIRVVEAKAGTAVEHHDDEIVPALSALERAASGDHMARAADVAAYNIVSGS